MIRLNIMYLVVILMAIYKSNLAQGFWLQGVTTNLKQVSSIVETKNGDIYASSSNDIYRSKDLGNSWQRMSQLGTAIQLKVDKNDNIYSINSNSVSSDAGKSWNEIVILIEGQKIRPHLLDVNDDGNLVAIIERGGYIFYSNSFNDEWKILDELPDRINFISFDKNNRILAFADIGIFISEGENWKFKKAHDGFAYIDNKFWGKSANITGITFNQNGEIFLVTKNMGVFQGNDSATEWVSKNNGLSSLSIRCITINSRGDFFIGIDAKKNIYKSTDNGENWIVSADGFDANSVDVIYSDKNDVLFAGCYDGIFISSDKGKSWFSTKQWEEISRINKIIIDNESNVFIASDHLYKTTDEGKTWENLSSAIQNQIYSLAIKDSLIIVGTSMGLSYSINNGKNWVKKKISYSADIYDILILTRDKIYVTSDYGVLSIEDFFNNSHLMNKYLINGKPSVLKSSKTKVIDGEHFPQLGKSSIKKYNDDIYFCALRKLFKLKENNIWEYYCDAESFEILSDGNMIIENGGSLFLLDTKNMSFNKIKIPGHELRKFFIDNKNRLYIYFTLEEMNHNKSNRKLYFSKDYGINWQDITYNLNDLSPNIIITELTVTIDDNIIIGTNDHGPFFSRNIK